jgi:guanosine-3',5'-bis(diphosphate) 3'-pyrophosphohydrolase
MIEKAKHFAAEAHKGQKRKNSQEDYIVHPIRVAETLQKEGYSKELICAGYLHDVVEDTDYTLKDIENNFGPTVKSLVAAHTEDKTKSWQARKKHTIETVRQGSFEVKALIVADKLDNLQSLQKELKIYGDAIWSNFNAGYESQKWYNQSISKAMTQGLTPNQTPNYFHQYKKLIKQTFD